jgi:hypothetical protein
MAKARTIGLQRELQDGFYNCCQIVAWADEQWLAWLEAAHQDGKSAGDIIRPLECHDPEAAVVPIVIRYTHNRRLGDFCDFW